MNISAADRAFYVRHLHNLAERIESGEVIAEEMTVTAESKRSYVEELLTQSKYEIHHPTGRAVITITYLDPAIMPGHSELVGLLT